MNAELVAAAYEFAGDKKHAEFCRELIRDQFSETQNGMGKTFAMPIRQTVFGLDRLQRALQPRPTQSRRLVLDLRKRYV